MEQKTAAAPTEPPIINVLSLPTKDDEVSEFGETEADDTEEYPGVEDDLSCVREDLGRMPYDIGEKVAVDVIGNVVNRMVEVVCGVLEEPDGM